MGVDYRIGRPFRHSPFPLGSPGISHHHLARLRKVAARFERDGRHPAPDRACSFASNHHRWKTTIDRSSIRAQDSTFQSN